MKEFISWLESPLNYFFTDKYYFIKATFAVLFLSIFTQFILYPSLGLHYSTFINSFRNGSVSEIQQIIILQKKSIDLPFQNAEFSYENHRFKMMFRLFLPILLRVLGIETYAGLFIFITQLILAPIFIYLLLTFFSEQLKSRKNAFYLTLLLGSLYYVSSFWMDTSGYGDAFAYFFLFIAIYTRKPLLIFIVTQLAAWTDERAVICLAGVFLWWAYFSSYSFKSKIRFINKQNIAVLLSLIIYAVIRIILSKFIFSLYLTNTSFVQEYLSVLYENMKNGGFSIWRAYKSLFGFVILLSLFLIKNKKYLLFLIYSISFGGSLLIGLGAYDLSRSLSFFFPYIFFSIIKVSKYISEKELHFILLILLFFTYFCSNLAFFRLTGGFTLL